MGGAGDTRRGLRVLVLSFLLTALLRLQAEALYIQVAAQQEKCIFEQGLMGNTMTLSYQVTEGELLDIDVEIRDPNNHLLLRRVRQTSGRYVFPVHLSGLYKFCFINVMSTLTPKEVMFTVALARDPATSTAEEDESINKLAEMILELGMALRAIKREQQHMQVRRKTQKIISGNISRPLTNWVFYEALILVVMALGQIYYLRRVFQARRRRTRGNAAG